MILTSTTYLGTGDCEALGTGWLLQPVEAWSSLAYSLVGIVLIVSSAGLLLLGMLTRFEVIDGMRQEEVTIEIDGVEVLVTTAKSATFQTDVIKADTLQTFGSYPTLEWEDPYRKVYLEGLTLRNSLTIGRMGLQISGLIMGLGVLFFLSGLPLTVAGGSAMRKS